MCSTLLKKSIFSLSLFSFKCERQNVAKVIQPISKQWSLKHRYFPLKSRILWATTPKVIISNFPTKYYPEFWALVDYGICTALRKESTAASNCVGCGACEKHCPQHIEIRKHLKDASKELEVPVYKLLRKVNEKWKLF